MEDIIAPIARDKIIAELTEAVFLRTTSKANNQLYLVNHRNAPHVVQEVGRLREVSFRAAGGGTGKSVDLDAYDLAERPYNQLIVWDPEDREITAGYRLIKCGDAERAADGRILSATAKLFNLTDRFLDHYLPKTIELGRSFVQPKYQRGAARKGLFALDNLWDGLAAVMLLNDELEYMFGKVTMYPDYHREARNILLSFMHHFFPDHENLVLPHLPLITKAELAPFAERFQGMPYKQAHQQLMRELKERGEQIPPLINSYMGLSATMKVFGTAENSNFGRVEETGILVRFQDIDPARKARYEETFTSARHFPGPLALSKA